MFKNKDEDLDESGHFNRNFDEDLSTFNNLHHRLSNRQVPGTAPSGQAAAGTSSAVSYQPLEPTKEMLAKMKKAAGGFFSNHGAKGQPMTASQSSSKTTTINYSYKPPTGLNADFKCTKLAENGKRCK